MHHDQAKPLSGRYRLNRAWIDCFRSHMVPLDLLRWQMWTSNAAVFPVYPSAGQRGNRRFDGTPDDGKDHQSHREHAGSPK